MSCASPFDPRVILVPSSFWHLDLSESSLSMNTFLHATTRCRFPRRLFYVDGKCHGVDVFNFVFLGFNLPGRMLTFS
jgi:hypothetical protein